MKRMRKNAALDDAAQFVVKAQIALLTAKIADAESADTPSANREVAWIKAEDAIIAAEDALQVSRAFSDWCTKKHSNLRTPSPRPPPPAQDQEDKKIKRTRLLWPGATRPRPKIRS